MSVRVYKLGGPALEDPELLPAMVDEIRRAPGRVLVVHGGGRHVERALQERGLESRFVGGRRQTSPEAMAVVEMVLSGLVNKGLAAGFTAAGLPSVGLSGRDAGLLRARVEPGLGRVGQPEGVDPRVLEAAWSAGLVPVVSPVALGHDGGALNVNADEAALALAVAVHAETLVYLSDVDGVRLGGAAVEVLTAEEARRHVARGEIAGGMAMKVETALQAVAAGVAEVVVAGKARLLGGFAGTRLGAAPRTEARP
ncbi:MAG TPA: acetylglutamate kinase [Vicinamibacteria bacterium]|nr:acetylglutamate kinase [Vicinamibacteria bacterium]